MCIIVTLISLLIPRINLMKLILVDFYLLLPIWWIQFFHRSLINFLCSSILWFKDFQKLYLEYLFKSFLWISLKMKYFHKSIWIKKKKKHIYDWQKYLKMPLVKIWLEFITVQLTKKFAYAYDTHFKIISRIMTDNFLPGHIWILCIPSNNFWNT